MRLFKAGAHEPWAFILKGKTYHSFWLTILKTLAKSIPKFEKLERGRFKHHRQDQPRLATDLSVLGGEPEAGVEGQRLEAVEERPIVPEELEASRQQNGQVVETGKLDEAIADDDRLVVVEAADHLRKQFFVRSDQNEVRLSYFLIFLKGLREHSSRENSQVRLR